MNPLLQQFMAALSWEIAPIADNPAYQGWLERERNKNPLFVNPLGKKHEKYADLFTKAIEYLDGDLL